MARRCAITSAKSWFFQYSNVRTPSKPMGEPNRMEARTILHSNIQPTYFRKEEIDLMEMRGWLFDALEAISTASKMCC